MENAHDSPSLPCNLWVLREDEMGLPERAILFFALDFRGTASFCNAVQTRAGADTQHGDS